MNNECSHGRSLFTFCNSCELEIHEADEQQFHQPVNPSIEQEINEAVSARMHCEMEERFPELYHPPESPSYYKRGKIEVIDFIEDQKLDFRAANVIKYICRFPYKGKALADLKKAAWYVNRLIEEQEMEANRVDYEKTLSQ